MAHSYRRTPDPDWIIERDPAAGNRTQLNFGYDLTTFGTIAAGSSNFMDLVVVGVTPGTTFAVGTSTTLSQGLLLMPLVASSNSVRITVQNNDPVADLQPNATLYTTAFVS